MISDEQVRESFKNIIDLPDVVEGFKRLHTRKIKDHHIDGRVNIQVYRGLPARDWEGAPKGGCDRCDALFLDFDVIPKYCFGCYKVVIELHTVLELFKLQMVFEKIKLPRDNTRKTMVDNRKLSTVKYKGLVYCRGLDEAEAIRDIVNEAVQGDISVTGITKVKRGCSEYPEKYPEYGDLDADFKYRKEWKFYEDYVDKLYVFPGEVDCYDEDGKGTDPVREILAFQYWLKYAATIGDNSYLVVTGGKLLEPLVS